MLKEAVICGGQRTPFVKSMTLYRQTTTQELMTAALGALAKKFDLQDQVLGDVALGAVMNPSNEWAMARESVLGSGLHPWTPAHFIQRACGTGLEAVNQIASKIRLGQIEWGVGGGVDTNTDLPVLYPRSFSEKIVELNLAKTSGERFQRLLQFRWNDLKPRFPAVAEARTGLSMGQHCEQMVQEWKISRAEQDQLAYESHQKGARAYEEGFFNEMIFDFKGVKKDSLLRAETTLEKLAKLKPAFDAPGDRTLTAGNSTALTDGASCVLLASREKAEKQGLPILAKFVDCEVAALDFVRGEGLLIAPALAVSRLLERNRLGLQDFDFYEIHEAFAGQVLCTLKAWSDPTFCQKVLGRTQVMGEIPRDRLNVKGGSLALGHPFAATGGRIVASLAHLLKKRGQGRGLISICTAGGMGVAAILEAA
jgi:acetyl-CoA C-acetyltransferase